MKKIMLCMLFMFLSFVCVPAPQAHALKNWRQAEINCNKAVKMYSGFGNGWIMPMSDSFPGEEAALYSIYNCCNLEAGYRITPRGVMSALDWGILNDKIPQLKADGIIPAYYQYAPIETNPKTGTFKLKKMWNEGYDFSSVFNADWYRENVRTTMAKGSDELLFIEGWVNRDLYYGIPAHPDFNVEAYIEYNPDLYAVYKNDVVAYIIHYIEKGQYEGRITNYE